MWQNSLDLIGKLVLVGKVLMVNGTNYKLLSNNTLNHRCEH